MAWRDKDKLIAECASLKREIELIRDQFEGLKEDKLNLINQLKYTQEALIAKEAPEAYRDRKYAEEQAALPPVSEEALASKRAMIKKAEITTRYIEEMENPLFKSPEDMIQTLTRVSGIPLQESPSLHGNDES